MQTFGRQRPWRDFLSIALLLLGFSALAAAFLLYSGSYLGVLLPLAFLAGAWASLRTEVRALEIHDDRLVVRTFFRSYPMPREHIIRVVRTHLGPAVDVLNGSRYTIAPVYEDHDAVADALERWLSTNATG